MKNLSSFPLEVQNWVALRTSARWEKKIALGLTEAGVPNYLPVISRVVQYTGKRRTTEVPLFSGYVFCSESSFIGNPRVSAACRKQIAQVLRPSDPERLKQELLQIAEITSSHELIQERIYGSPGDRVRIISGPLCGSQGIVRSLKPRKRILVLEISFLGTRLEVEVEEHQVEKE
jgi:transcriptional antiterminator RfaH